MNKFAVKSFIPPSFPQSQMLFPYFKERKPENCYDLNFPITDLSVEKSVLIAEKNQGGRNHTSNRGRCRGRGNRPAAYCDHCAREGHSRDRCWVLHPHLKPRRDKTSGGGGNQPSVQAAVTSSASELPKFTLAQLSQLLQQLGDVGNKSAPVGEGQTAPKSGNPAGNLLNLKILESVNPCNQRNGSIPNLGKVRIMRKEKRCPHFTNSPLEIKCITTTFIGCKSLAAHLNKTNVNNEWVVDSGATDHMINCSNSLAYLTQLKNIQNVYMTDGSTTSILETGQINLFNKPIKNILYIPSFPFNLLSIGKITCELNCNVIFSPSSVTFQDRVTDRTIGEGVYP
jgi:hypothetical protein